MKKANVMRILNRTTIIAGACLLLLASPTLFTGPSAFAQEEEIPPDDPLFKKRAEQRRQTAEEEREAAPEDAFDDVNSLLEFSTLPAEDSARVTSKDDEILQFARRSADMRDPFWPYGFKPKPKPKPEEEPKEEPKEPEPPPKVESKPLWDDAVRALSIQGIMSAADGAYMAVINGQVASEDDVVAIVYKGKRYSWEVESITQNGVKFRKLQWTE